MRRYKRMCGFVDARRAGSRAAPQLASVSSPVVAVTAISTILFDATVHLLFLLYPYVSPLVFVSI